MWFLMLKMAHNFDTYNVLNAEFSRNLSWVNRAAISTYIRIYGEDIFSAFSFSHSFICAILRYTTDIKEKKFNQFVNILLIYLYNFQ